MLRDLVLTRMGRYNDEATVAEARKRFAEHVKGTKALPADLRGPVSVLFFFGFLFNYTLTLRNSSNQIRQTNKTEKGNKINNQQRKIGKSAHTHTHT